MTEYEKMISGELYDCFDEKLAKLRANAEILSAKYNKIGYENSPDAKELLKNLLGKIGNNAWVRPPLHVDYGINIEIGDNFLSNFNCTILDCASVKIGNNCMFGPNVGIYTANHPIDPILRTKYIAFAMPIVIGDNVWIGGHVVVNPGVTIGDNVVIGSGSVVTKDIPRNSLAVGNPAKVIRQIGEKDLKYHYKDKLIDEKFLK